MLKDFITSINDAGLNVEGVVIRQNNEQVAEYRWIPEAPRQAFSLSKSFTSMAAGLAIEEGLLSLETRPIDIFPQYERKGDDKKWQALTLRHLLMMASGHETEPPRDAGGDDLIEKFFAHELIYQPGEHFLYNNLCSHLISAMLQEVTGQKMSDFLAPRLFDPLGIDAPRWDTDSKGITMGAAHLYLTTTQISRFGQMLLDGGMYQSKQMVPRSWIEEVQKKHIENKDLMTGWNKPDWNEGYGYQFWRCRHDCYRADGARGQWCIVIEKHNAVIAMNCDEADTDLIMDRIWEHIYTKL